MFGWELNEIKHTQWIKWSGWQQWTILHLHFSTLSIQLFCWCWWLYDKFHFIHSESANQPTIQQTNGKKQKQKRNEFTILFSSNANTIYGTDPPSIHPSVHHTLCLIETEWINYIQKPRRSMGMGMEMGMGTGNESGNWWFEILALHCFSITTGKFS